MATITVEDGTGLVDSNSYCTVAEADDYHENNRLHTYTNWSAVADQEAALIWATRILDEQVAWKGSQANDTQALRWPRGWVYSPDGVIIDEDEIPTWLKHATAELAYHLSQADRLAETDTKGFEYIKVSGIEIVPDKYDRKGIIHKAVWSIISPYGSSKKRRTKLVLG